MTPLARPALAATVARLVEEATGHRVDGQTADQIVEAVAPRMVPVDVRLLDAARDALSDGDPLELETAVSELLDSVGGGY